MQKAVAANYSGEIDTFLIQNNGKLGFLGNVVVEATPAIFEFL